MPIYAYAWTDLAGGEFEEYQKVADAALTEKDGRPCERVLRFTPTAKRTKTQNRWEMWSIALDNEDEIEEFRKRNPGTQISADRRDANFGIPIVKSVQEKRRVLKAEGFQDKNSYF